jgi:hypothetical protein
MAAKTFIQDEFGEMEECGKEPNERGEYVQTEDYDALVAAVRHMIEAHDEDDDQAHAEWRDIVALLIEERALPWRDILALLIKDEPNV